MTAGSTTAHRRRVAAYYDATQVLYSALWSGRAVHNGLWDAATRAHRHAIGNVDRLVATSLALPAGGRVLDAGCGIGGTSCHLAARNGLRVTGITLSRVQARRARRRAAQRRVTPRPRFLIADYLRSGFRDGAFDGVVAVESACHAEHKGHFLAEAARVLRSGGRLVVVDGFRNAQQEPAGDHYRQLLSGMALPDLAVASDFRQMVAAAGFELERDVDLTTRILPSARRIAKLSAIGVRVCRALALPRTWTLHGMAGLAQLPLFENGALSYRAVVAHKR